MSAAVRPFGSGQSQLEEPADCGLPAGGERPVIALKTAATFVGEYEPIAYLIDRIVASSKLYTLTARTGSGKTGFNVVAALAVAANRPEMLGRKVERGRVAYIACENAEDARMRLAVTAFAYGIDLDALGSRMIVHDDREKPERIVHALRLDAAKNGPFALILVDTFAAIFDGKDVNNPVEAGEFMRRLRPLTQIPGRPAVVVSAHPVKNATESALVPYGAGAIVNEIDGNLTLWNEGAISTLHWQRKLRGLDFEPAPFRFELLDCPTILDIHGRRVKLPVMMPCSAEAVEEKQKDEAQKDRALLQAMVDEPDATQERWGEMIGQRKGRVNGRLRKLERQKLVRSVTGKWLVTTEGAKVVRTMGKADDTAKT
jgi:hypothetical protein